MAALSIPHRNRTILSMKGRWGAWPGLLVVLLTGCIYRPVVLDRMDTGTLLPRITGYSPLVEGTYVWIVLCNGQGITGTWERLGYRTLLLQTNEGNFVRISRDSIREILLLSGGKGDLRVPRTPYLSPVRAYLVGMLFTPLFLDRKDPLWGWALLPAGLGLVAVGVEYVLREWNMGWRNRQWWVVRSREGTSCGQTDSSRKRFSLPPPVEDFP